MYCFVKFPYLTYPLVPKRELLVYDQLKFSKREVSPPSRISDKTRTSRADKKQPFIIYTARFVCMEIFSIFLWVDSLANKLM